jgi:hypothetical protein
MSMTPLEQLIAAIRQAITDGHMTREGVERLRQIALHVIDHDTTSAEDVRVALRAALDTSQRPDARSFATDAGFGASRATY